MKILLIGGVSSRNAGGIFQTMVDMGRALHAMPGMDVHFLLHDDEESLKDRVYFEGLNLHIYTIIGPKNFAYSNDIYHKIASIGPDLVHIMGLWLYLAVANNKYFTNTMTPYLVSPHGMLDEWQLKQTAYKNLTKKIALKLYEGSHLGHAACIHALNSMESEAIRKFGLLNPVAVVPNGTILPATPAPATSSEHSDLPHWKKPGCKTLLYLSRIHVKKGLDNLLQAWKKARGREHGWQLVIAGETADRKYWDKLQHDVSSLGIGDSVAFIGGQFGANKDRTFAHADAFILPSFSEGLPMVVLEAWSHHLPVLMTEHCHLPEGFQHDAAIEIEPNVAGIAQGISRITSFSTEQLRQVGDNGYQLVTERFTWNSVAAQFSEIYAWLIGEGKQPLSVVPSPQLKQSAQRVY